MIVPTEEELTALNEQGEGTPPSLGWVWKPPRAFPSGSVMEGSWEKGSTSVWRSTEGPWWDIVDEDHAYFSRAPTAREAMQDADKP